MTTGWVGGALGADSAAEAGIADRPFLLKKIAGQGGPSRLKGEVAW